jgi:uncharacterized protein (TIGR03067 family)
MNDVKLAHPSLDRLMAFGQGRLAEAELAELSAHLSDCGECRAKVEDAADDTLISLLRAADTDPDHTETEDPQEAATMAPLSPTGDYAVPQNPGLPAELADHARYRVQELLGVGGMGSVYKAEHLLMERPVALKLVSQSLTSNPAMVERFRREVKTAGQLKHPNIVMAYDAEQAGDSHFLVMEYVEGKSLARLVSEQGLLPVHQACDYIRQAALGLQYAHECGMVHRDIKPHNLMLTPDGQVKILDFGLARFAMEAAPAGALLTAPGDATTASTDRKTASDSLTQVGTVMGTPDYIAPEQATDAHTADIRADIYSLGCTLYDLLAGHAPFPEGTAVAKVMAHAERMPKPLAELREDVPAELAHVVGRMMAKEPAKRYQTPAEVAKALEPFASRAPRRRRRRHWVAVAALVVAGLVTAAGVVYKIHRDNEEIVIKTEDPDIEIVMKRKGEVVLIRDAKSGQTWEYDTLKNQIGLADQPDGLTLSLDKEPFVLRRKGKDVFTVTRVDKAAASAKSDQALLQGIWKGILGMQSGQRVNHEEVKQVTVKFIGNTIDVSVPGVGKGTFELDARTTPKRIAVTYGEPGKRKTSRGVYTLDGDILRICIGAPEEGAIEDIGTDAGMDITLRREAPASSDLERIQGAWKAVHIEEQGITSPPDDVLKRTPPTLSVAGNNVTWKGHSRDRASPIEFNGRVYLDPAKQPKTIDFFYLGKDAKPMLGIYRLENDTLTLCWNIEPREPDDRPTEFATKGKKWILIVWQRVPEVGREAARPSDQEKIQGSWKGVSVSVQGLELPEAVFQAIGPSITFADKKVTWKADPGPEMKDAFGGMLARFSLDGVFSLDPAKSPKTIDLTVLGKDPKTPLGTPAPRAILGIYKLEGDSLELCIAIDPEHAEERPAKFESVPGKFIAHVKLKRAADATMPEAKLINFFAPGYKPITRDGIAEDEGGWKIDARRERFVRLYEVQPPVEDCLIYYRAKIKTSNLRGSAYLVMWARMPQGGEYFSEGVTRATRGTTDWKSVEIPFVLQKDERPDMLKLGLQIESNGPVDPQAPQSDLPENLWIKDIEIRQMPLPAEMKRPSAVVTPGSNGAFLWRKAFTTAPLTQDGVVSDQDGWRIDVSGSRTVNLQEFTRVKEAIPDTATLQTFRARMKTENLQGKAYLELTGKVPEEGDKNRRIARGPALPLTGTTDWASCETTFRCEAGQPLPSDFKLNLVVEGKGTVWIKDMELLRGPAPLDPGERVGMDMLRGVWLAESMEINGKPASAKELAGTRFTFTKDKLLIRDSKREGNDQEAQYLMADFTRSPKHLDITIKNKTLHGIFEVKGDVLKVCYETGDNSANRPTKFATNREEELVLIVFKRQKP